MPAHRLRLAGTTVRLSLALLLSAVVVVATLVIPSNDSTPEAAPDPTAVRTPEPSPVPSTKPAPPHRDGYACPTYSGIDRPNPLADLYRDTFTWGTTAPYKVGDGKGNINWRVNPDNNPSWYMWLHSLRWLGQGITAAGKGDRNALARVAAIAHDWVNDNPHSWKGDVGAYESTMHRTNVLICLRQATLSALHVSRLPLNYSWLDKALLDHAWFLQKNWSGAWNHGTDESIALFGVGCTLGRSDLKKLAVSRLTSAITTSIDAQGSTNEQSTSYAQFNYSLWGRAVDVLQQCGVDAGTTIKARRLELAKWLALGTNSLGRLHQIGDTEVVKTYPFPGTGALEYAGSLGTHGIRPTERIGIFDAGYIFGRTGWSETRPFTQESSYSIRFGPARALHGHDDHTSITYTSHGRDILVDGGHAGYKNDDWRVWAKSEFAHNEMTVLGTDSARPTTKLERSSIAKTSEFYELSDSLGSGIERDRSVLVMRDPDLMVVLDRGTSSSNEDYQTLWHLPSDQKVTVQGAQAVALAPGDRTKTTLLQIPFQQDATPIQVATGKTDPIQGWHFLTIDKRKPAPVVKFTRSGRSASILSVIVPTRSNARISYTTSWQGSRMLINLKVDQVTTTVAVAPDGTLQRIK
ncbi:hypothetical protein E0H73_22650 [Kribbella pittospori]|uniref:Heparinase II/III-like C-terminal domain-containing protein n=1 Tax=Kribbella pittospori TaxID=722689 RepID=A0A4R0KG56_9ACTN|nr:heparinase II/III family protein [Kribbella pittospori]TCC59441.1 hypothetical protein E0H73_22650 [Kribbella pittospori]